MVATHPITTAEQLLAAGDIGRCELLSGELHMMTPAGYEHGRIAGKLALLIHSHVLKHQLGDVVAAETGFVLSRNPDTVRAPDVAYIRKERLANAPRRGFFEGAPDLLVEVLSPDDTAEYIADKVEEWLSAGCRMVWVINPRNQSAVAYNPDRTARLLNAADTLDGGEVLPGLRIPVKTIFE